MSRPTKSLDVTDRLGVYKRLDDVPDRHRLHRHAPGVPFAPAWDEFCSEHEYGKGESEDFRRKVDRAHDHWVDYCVERKIFAIGPKPQDIEGWSWLLLDEYTRSTAYKYWIRIEHFFRWLMWHTEYPHVYHPVLMAVAEFDGSAREIWDWKAADTKRRREARA